MREQKTKKRRKKRRSRSLSRPNIGSIARSRANNVET